MKNTRKLFALFICLFAGINLMAQIGKPQFTMTNRRGLDSVIVGTANDTIMCKNDLLQNTANMPTNTDWLDGFCYNNVITSLALKVKETEKNAAFIIPDTFSCIVKLNCTGWMMNTSTNLLNTFTESNVILKVNYNKLTGAKYTAINGKEFSNLHALVAKVTYISNASASKWLYLETKFMAQKGVCLSGFDYETVPPAAQLTINNNFINIFLPNASSNIIKQADEVEIEYTHLDWYTLTEMEVLVHDENSSYNPNDDYRLNGNFYHNSTKLILPINQINNIKIRNVFEKGVVVVRYRTIAYYVNAENQELRLASQWSLADNIIDLFIDEGQLPANHAIAVNTHQQKLNWQFITTFAEEGKTKETLTYLDGTTRTRQTLTTNNSDNTLLVTETLYDKIGRPAIQMLPNPINLTGVTTNHFNYQSFNYQTTGNKNFDYKQFDKEQGNCQFDAVPIVSNKGVNQYYSANNPNVNINHQIWDENKYIPNAEGFPYTKTIYTPDNTGRVKLSTGVGATHHNTNKNTQYFYTTPLQEEITRLFGTNVGHDEHYKKNVVIDPNGQASISILDLKGKTIATGLSFAKNHSANQFSPLPTNLPRQSIEVDLLPTEARYVSATELLFNKSILLTESGPLKLKYSVNPRRYNVSNICTTGFCFTGIYDLEIAIYNDCAENVFDGKNGDALVTKFKKTIGGNPKTTNSNSICEPNNPYSFYSDNELPQNKDVTDQYITIPDLPAGNYTVVRKLKLNQEALDSAEAYYFRNASCSTYDQFLAASMSNMDFSNCNQVETKSSTEVGYQECDMFLEVLKSDIRPGGQYAEFTFNTTDYSVVFKSTEENIKNSTWAFLPTEWSTSSYTDQYIYENWKPEWENDLVKNHPEYCYYQGCIDKANELNLRNKIAETNTSSEAINLGFISPDNQYDFIYSTRISTFQNNSTFLPTDVNNKLDYYQIKTTTDGTVTLSVDMAILYDMFYDRNELVSNAVLDERILSLKNKLNSCGDAQKNLFWHLLKSAVLAEFNVPTYPSTSIVVGVTPCRTIPTGKEVRYTTPTSVISDLNTMKDNGDQLVKNQIAETCASYKVSWKEKLAGCQTVKQLTDTEMEIILEELKKVCILGGDENHPMGSSNVAPQHVTGATFVSFEDVFKKHTKNNLAIYDKEFCSDLQLTMPPAYHHKMLFGMDVFADTCQCKETPVPANCPCSTAIVVADYKQVQQLLMPAATPARKCKSCVDCSQINNALVQLNGIETFVFNDYNENNQSIINHLNKTFGFNLTYHDYDTVLSKCMGIEPSTILDDKIFEVYFKHYGLLPAQSLKENRLIALHQKPSTIKNHNQFIWQESICAINEQPVASIQNFYNANEQNLAYINATQTGNYNIDLDPSNMYHFIGCVCKDLRMQPKATDKINHLTNANSAGLSNPQANSTISVDSLARKVLSTCELFDSIYNTCRKSLAIKLDTDPNNLSTGPNDYCNMEAFEKMRDILKVNPINVEFSTSYLQEIGCCYLITPMPQDCNTSGPGSGGGTTPPTPAVASYTNCLEVMPKFQHFYNQHIKTPFEAGPIHTVDLKTYLKSFLNANSGAKTYFVDLLNSPVYFIDPASSTDAMVETLWAMLKQCNTPNCELFNNHAFNYDANNKEDIAASEFGGLFNMALNHSQDGLFLQFKDNLNDSLNKPPYITFFDDETVVKYFKSCSANPCEVINSKIQNFPGGLIPEVIKNLKNPAHSTIREQLVQAMNVELNHAPYFIPVTTESIIGAIDMCYTCSQTALQAHYNDIIADVSTLFQKSYNVTNRTYSLNMMLTNTGWNFAQNASNLASKFYPANSFKNVLTYEIISQSKDNSFMLAQTDNVTGNQFYVKIKTVSTFPNVGPLSYIPINVVPDFKFSNIKTVTNLEVVKYSAFEIEILAEATYLTVNNNTYTRSILITIPSYPYYKDFVALQPCKTNFQACNKPLYPSMTFESPCEAMLKNAAKINATHQYVRYIEQKKAAFRANYIAAMMNATGLSENFKIKYTDRQYHFTLYYYDQAGNLVNTVPPAGVTPINATNVALADASRIANGSQVLPVHTKVTTYQYNTLNQLVAQTTPDAGSSQFWYDAVGRLVLSQNAKQAMQTNKQYSYTIYDGMSRITEVGLIDGLLASPNFASIRTTLKFTDWLSTNSLTTSSKSQITKTFYDETHSDFDGLTINPFLFNLRNRVAHSAYYETNTTTPNNSVHYSYDAHGNVATLFREVSELSPLNQNVKQIDYQYDLLSGKVNKVIYQAGEPDQFIHQYAYDAENRLLTVYTGANQHVLEKDARYYYYKHGPLARTELGMLGVQGLDYAYTIQGWLKSVNAPSLLPFSDPGKDGYLNASNANKYVAKDVVGFELGYFNGDYLPVGDFSSNMPQTTNANVANINTSAPDLYNGNIKYMVTNIKPFSMQLSAYKYDQLNRIAQANYFNNYNAGTNSWANSAPINAYNNTFTYDADGNIKTQLRNGQAGAESLDDLTYHYAAGTNKLLYVTDAVNAGLHNDDIDNQATSNYNYDAIGNLIKDEAEEIAEIKWNVYGKIASIIRTSGSVKPNLIFTYSPDGHRLSKTVIPKNGNYATTTYYVRDAQGNILATYNKQTHKIIDYSGLTFAQVNAKLNSLTGNDWTNFGNFIGNLHSTHINNATFNNSLKAELLNATTVLPNRLREMENIEIADQNDSYKSWLYANLTESSFRNQLMNYSSNYFNNLLSCEPSHLTSYLNYFAKHPWLAVAFFKSVVSYDDANATNYANTVSNTLVNLNANPYTTAFETALLNHLNSRSANYVANIANFVAQFEDQVNNNSMPFAQIVADIDRLPNPQDAAKLEELITYYPELRFKVKAQAIKNCGTTIALEDILASTYAAGFYHALNRADFALFASMLTNFGGSTSNASAEISHMLGITVTNKVAIANYLEGQGVTINSQRLQNILYYYYIADPTECMALLNSTYITGNYVNCANTIAYNCVPMVGQTNILLQSLLGKNNIWTELLKINTATNLATQVYDANRKTFFDVAAKYHPSTVSQLQQANPTIYGTNGMQNYFGYIQTLTSQATYNSLVNHFMGQSNTYTDTLKLNDFTLYGSSRLGVQNCQTNIAAAKYTATYTGGQFTNVVYDNTATYNQAVELVKFTLERGHKNYELSNHLGNVLAVVTDKKIPVYSSGTLTHYEAELVTATDYSPFGAIMPGRNFSSSNYRFGFNGYEKDDEVVGAGGSYDFGERIYNPRLGRFLSVDPLSKKFAFWSPYIFAGNTPIRFVDVNGEAPGDKFTSIEAAARDFGKLYNDNSIKDKREYGSTIVKITTDKGVYYTYLEPRIGTNASVAPTMPGVTSDAVVVARIHAHANYDPDYDNNHFSPADMTNAKNKGVLSYVTTPNGSLQLYDPKTGKVTVVATDLPSDPNDPDRLNKVDASKLPKNEPTYGTSDWIIDNILLPLGEGASAIQNKAATGTSTSSSTSTTGSEPPSSPPPLTSELEGLN